MRPAQSQPTGWVPPRTGRRAFLLAAAAGAFGGALAAGLRGGLRQSAATQAGESVRVWAAMWVRMESVLDPQAVRAAVAMARQLGLRALYLQVLVRGEAAYRSSLWPLARRPLAAADPLADALQQAHQAGLEAHAWMAVYPWGRLDRPPTEPGHPLVRHPEWVTVDRWGRSLWQYRPGERPEVNALFVDPALEGVTQTVVESVLEVVRRYDVDGVHLDYVRYPGPDFGYHPGALLRFWQLSTRPQGAPVPEGQAVGSAGQARQGGPGGWAGAVAGAAVRLPASPEEWEAWGQFRQSQVTQAVHRIAHALRSEGFGLKLSAAVMPELARARAVYSQDWGRWVREQLVDYVVLMSYGSDPQQVGQQVAEGVRAFGARIHAGIGIYRLEPQQPEQAARLVEAARAAGAAGLAFFSFEALEGRPLLQQAVRASLQREPA